MTQRTRRVGIADCGAHALAANHAAQAQALHQPFHREAHDVETFAPQLSPELAHAVDGEVFIPDALDFGPQLLVAPGSLRVPLRIGLPGLMGVVGRWGNRHRLPIG